MSLSPVPGARSAKSTSQTNRSNSLYTPTDSGASPRLLAVSDRKKQSILEYCRAYLAEDIDAAWGDTVLVFTCLITGLLDSAVFSEWGCFVSMQTGNTVYLGLGFASQPASSPYRWLKSLVAIISFLLGSYVFTSFSRTFGPLRRSSLILSFLVQALLIFVSAALSTSGVVPQDAGDRLPGDAIVLLPLALLSFQSAGQCAMSRALGFSELTTVVLTSAYADLMGDSKLFASPISVNPKRNRRALGVVFLLGGAIIGGFTVREDKIQNALWVAGGMKLAAAVIWVGWQGEGGGAVRLP